MQLTAKEKIAVPLTLSLIIFIVLWATHPFIIAVSFLGGAITCWIGNAVFAWLLIRKIKKKRPEKFLFTYYLSEILKLALYVVLFVIVALFFRLHLHPMLTGFMLNIVVFALLFINALGDI